MLGEPFSAQTALELGIVNAVVPDGQALPHAFERCRKLAAQPAAAVRLTKALMRQVRPGAVDATMRTEADVFRERLQSPEAKEAFTAFFEKRKPDFSRFG